MILHPSSLDYNSFCEKYNIPKSCLPKEYGGELDTIPELHEKFRKELVGKRDYFLAEEEMRNIKNE